MENPRISFVIAARNAEHDSTFVARLRTTLRILNALTSRHNLSSEFVIVQYNPPRSKPLLEFALADMSIDTIPVRVITVPESFHTRIAPGRKGPFLEYVAKNIGIRRAAGTFILVTNLDIVFSDEMIARLAQSLEPNAVYRANRHDLEIYEISESIDIDEALRLCHSHTDRIWTENGLLYVSWSRWFRRFLRRPKPRNVLVAPLFNPIKKLLPARPIHDAAAGDFLLAHRNAWNTVRGYDQQLVDAHLDGYNIGMFVCYGFQQVVLPQPIFHINHNQNPSRQLPDVEKYKRDMKAMAKTHRPYTVYSEDWGFPSEQFPEQRIIFDKK